MSGNVTLLLSPLDEKCKEVRIPTSENPEGYSSSTLAHQRASTNKQVNAKQQEKHQHQQHILDRGAHGRKAKSSARVNFVIVLLQLLLGFVVILYETWTEGNISWYFFLNISVKTGKIIIVFFIRNITLVQILFKVAYKVGPKNQSAKQLFFFKNFKISKKV